MLRFVEPTISAAQKSQEMEEQGQSSLFEGGAKNPDEFLAPPDMNVPMWQESEKLEREKSVLGFYVSGHPLLRFEQEINAFSSVRLGEAGGTKNGTVRACGIITSIKKKIDKRNKEMAFVAIEDFTGKCECVIFSSIYKDAKDLIQPEAMVMVEGNGEVSGDVLKIIATAIIPMESVREKYAKRAFLLVNADETNDSILSQLKDLMKKHKGNCQCFFNVKGSDFPEEQVLLARNYSVQLSDEFMNGVYALLGPNTVKFA
jgi:DNA polymerase-3 subunit alpha